MATVRVDGLRELDRALAQLPRATARNVLVRVGKRAAAPVRDAAQANAPRETGELQGDILVGTRLTKSQTRDAKREGKNWAEVYIGTDLSRGMFTEFGTFKDAPQMWFTRAWASTQDQALTIIKSDLGAEIEKSASRLRAKGKL